MNETLTEKLGGPYLWVVATMFIVLMLVELVFDYDAATRQVEASDPITKLEESASLSAPLGIEGPHMIPQNAVDALASPLPNYVGVNGATAGELIKVAAK